jgi:hypothetical protein
MEEKKRAIVRVSKTSNLEESDGSVIYFIHLAPKALTHISLGQRPRNPAFQRQR